MIAKLEKTCYYVIKDTKKEMAKNAIQRELRKSNQAKTS